MGQLCAAILPCRLDSLVAEPVDGDFPEQVREQSHQQCTPAVGVIDYCTFEYGNAFEFTQILKITQGTEVNIRGVVPAVGQTLGHRHEASDP